MQVVVDVLLLQGLWDRTDGFYYDRLHMSSQQTVSLRIRSLVGLMPLIAVHVIPQSTLRHLPRLARQLMISADASVQQPVSLSVSLLASQFCSLWSVHLEHFTVGYLPVDNTKTISKTTEDFPFLLSLWNTTVCMLS